MITIIKSSNGDNGNLKVVMGKDNKGFFVVKTYSKYLDKGKKMDDRKLKLSEVYKIRDKKLAEKQYKDVIKRF